MKSAFLQVGLSMLVLIVLAFTNVIQAQSLVPMNFMATKAKTAERKSVLETISTSGRAELTELIMKAGLISELSGKTDYTFFAPSEEAIQKLSALPTEKLHGILMNHIVPGRITTNDFKEGTKLKTLGGDPVTIIRKGNTILVSGIPIANPDEKAGNGIIHTLSGSLY